MRDAVIVSAVRTAVGKAPRGTLRETPPEELAMAAVREALARARGSTRPRSRTWSWAAPCPRGPRG